MIETKNIVNLLGLGIAASWVVSCGKLDQQLIHLDPAAVLKEGATLVGKEFALDANLHFVDDRAVTNHFEATTTTIFGTPTTIQIGGSSSIIPGSATTINTPAHDKVVNAFWYKAAGANLEIVSAQRLPVGMSVSLRGVLREGSSNHLFFEAAYVITNSEVSGASLGSDMSPSSGKSPLEVFRKHPDFQK